MADNSSLDLEQQYHQEQAFMREWFPLVCLQVFFWIFFRPAKLPYYDNLSDEIRRKDKSEYPQSLLKVLFLDTDYNSYLSSQTTGYRLRRAVECILITVFIIFIEIPFLGAIIGIVPYFSIIPPIFMMIGLALIGLLCCLIVSGDSNRGVSPILASILVVVIIFLIIITIDVNFINIPDAPSGGLILFLLNYTLCLMMIGLCVICGFITFGMTLMAEFAVKKIVQTGKLTILTMSTMIFLIMTYFVFVGIYIVIVQRL